MTISIEIAADLEKTLRDQASAEGTTPEAMAARIVERTLRIKKEFDEIRGPIADAFEKSGMTEEQLGDLLEQEKHAMRAERRKRAS